MKNKYKVSATPDAVICTLKEKEEVLTEKEEALGIGKHIPIATKLEEVVGACIEHSNEERLIFPNFSPTTVELAVLDNWGKSQNITFYHEDKALVARRN